MVGIAGACLVALFCVWRFLPAPAVRQERSGDGRSKTASGPADDGKPFGPPAAEVLRAEEGAKMTTTGVSPLSWSCTPHATFEQRTDKALTLHRLDAKGRLRQLGQHSLPDGWSIHATPGPATYYGLIVSRADTYVIRVFDGPTELYEVPREVANWDGMRLYNGTVLAGGRLLVVYSMPVSPHDFGGGRHPVVAAILSQDGEGLARRELYRGTSGEQRHMFSGDGTTVVVVRQDNSMTTVYSADGSRRAAFPDLRTTSVSYNGNTIAGTKKGHLAIFRGSKQVAERPWDGGVPLVYLSANGQYVMAGTLVQPVSLLDAASLSEVFRAAAPKGFGRVADSAPSSAGLLAVLWRTGSIPSAGRRAHRRYQLVVYGLNGQVRLRRDLAPSAEHGSPVSRVIWSMDGQTLLYLDRAGGMIVQHRLAVVPSPAGNER